MNHFESQPAPQTPKPPHPFLGPIRTLASVATFSGEFLTKPGLTGSLVPSMPALGRRMAGYVRLPPAGYVVELGAGTGVITAALLRRGIPKEDIISIDCSSTMAKLLRERYPDLRILIGNAARLQALLAEHVDLDRQSVSHVVSSLPLRSLPKLEVARIARQIQKVLLPSGRFIQFTYDLRLQPHPALSRFRLLTSSVVWLNIPPARVNVYANTRSKERRRSS
jgi:phosphatidylethanolamine/phosphatidyl-N-methylethanolamine N-methyltransferase